MRFEVYRRHARWRWRLVTANKRVLVRSKNSYSRASHARDTIQKIAYWIGENETINVVTLFKEHP